MALIAAVSWNCYIGSIETLNTVKFFMVLVIMKKVFKKNGKMWNFAKYNFFK